MRIFDKIRYFFQKRANDFDANETFRRNQLRYNALYALDPDVLVRHLTAFERGDICGLERVIEEFETREDKMRIGAFKMAAAVASKPWEIRVNKGEEDNPRAKLHQETLTRFWNGIDVTDAFCRNRRGGLRLLVKQMMSAQSRVYAVHDIVWKVNGDGSLKATFTQVPAWCFENRTGRLRYIHNDGETHGEEMRDGEWLVTVGEGVGIAAVVIAMAKRLSWNDWLLFSSACGMPVIMGNTSAQKGTPAWEAMERAIRAVAPRTGILADTGTQLSAVSMGGNGQQTYRELIDVVDRAISALYRGGDLATMSSGPDAAGVNAQDGESELMDADGCAMVSETLRDQVERFVIRFTCGDFAPLAGIVINPPAETEDIDREIKIDQHLAQLGVRLSKADALQRYGRTEAKDDDDALKPSEQPQPGAFGGLPNEKNGTPRAKPTATPLKIASDPLKIASKDADAQGEVSDAPALLGAFLEGYAKDAEPAAQAIRELLADFTPEKARALVERLPDLLPEDPEMAAVLAEAMAGEFAGEAGEEEDAEDLANVMDANGMEHDDDGRFTGDGGGGVTPASELRKKSTEELAGINPWDDEKTRKMKMRLAKMRAGNDEIRADIAKRKAHIKEMKADIARMESEKLANVEDKNGMEHSEADGKFTGDGGGSSSAPSDRTEEKYTPATSVQVEAFLRVLPKEISSEEFDSLLTAGFADTDGAGNTVKYGKLLRDHINSDSRNEEDRDARKKRLGVIVKMVRGSKPVATTRSGGNERVYAGVVNGKAYVAVADEHGELNAMEMVSYRRDGKHDEK